MLAFIKGYLILCFLCLPIVLYLLTQAEDLPDDFIE